VGRAEWFRRPPASRVRAIALVSLWSSPLRTESMKYKKLTNGACRFPALRTTF
jgi:hypothetical protein